MDTATETTVTKFESGVSYYCRSACDHDCVWHFRIIRRTAKSVWIIDDEGGKICRKGLRVWDNVEKFEPFGRYSMSPVVSADRRSMAIAG